jgi:hypothetical protein
MPGGRPPGIISLVYSGWFTNTCAISHADYEDCSSNVWGHASHMHGAQGFHVVFEGVGACLPHAWSASLPCLSHPGGCSSLLLCVLLWKITSCSMRKDGRSSFNVYIYIYLYICDHTCVSVDVFIFSMIFRRKSHIVTHPLFVNERNRFHSVVDKCGHESKR